MEYLVRIYAKELRPKGIVRLRIKPSQECPVSCNFQELNIGIYRIETELAYLVDIIT